MSGFGLLLLGGLRRRFRVRTVWFRGVCWLTGFDTKGCGCRWCRCRGFSTLGSWNCRCRSRLSPNGPYNDRMGSDKLLRYKYRGTDPYHRDNVGLREVMRLRLPLVYFHGLVPSRYLTMWPVYIVDDSMGALEFSVSCEEAGFVDPSLGLMKVNPSAS